MTSLPSNRLLLPHYIFGIDSCRRKHIHALRYIGDEGIEYEVVLYIAGNCVVKLNAQNGNRSFAVNNDRGKFFCCLTAFRETVYVAESGDNASIFLCDLNDLKILGTLDGRTDKGYNCLDVRQDGQLLCGVTFDGNLTLWSLTKMQLLIQTKSFGDKVIYGVFSKCDPNSIMTSGRSCLKMWKMEETFTGPKLKGKYWQFGDIDVCSISCILQLQNGTIITGTEDGFLLHWLEKNATKIIAQLKDDDDSGNKKRLAQLTPLHEGGINCLYLDNVNGDIITGGTDGVLNWWQSDILLSIGSEATNSKYIRLQPIRTVPLSLHGIQNINFCSFCGTNELIISDDTGKLFKLNLVNNLVVQMVDYHEGHISALDVSPNEYLCATGATDKKIYCINFSEKKIISSILMSSACTCISWSPDARIFVCGFIDGSIKFMQLNNNKIQVSKCFQPFKSRVMHIAYHHCRSLLATCNGNGGIFLFEYGFIDGGIISALPLGFLQCNGLVPTSFRWIENSQCFEYVEANGSRYSAKLSDTLIQETKDNDGRNRTTYKLDIELLLIKSDPKVQQYITTNSKVMLCKQSFDGRFIVESSLDGILTIWQSFPDLYHGKEAIQSQLHVFSNKEMFQKVSFTEENTTIVPCPVNNEACFTLEEELIQKQLTSKNQITRIRKKRIFDNISRLRTEILSVRDLNSTLQPHLRLHSNAFFMHSFFSTMYDEIKLHEKEKAKLNYYSFANIAIAKREILQDIFVNSTEDEFKNVSSFCLQKIISTLKVMEKDNSFIRLKDAREQKKTRKRQDVVDRVFHPLTPTQSSVESSNRDESLINILQPQELSIDMKRKVCKKSFEKLLYQHNINKNLHLMLGVAKEEK